MAGRGGERGGEKNDSAALTWLSPAPSSPPPLPPTQGPFSDFWPNKSICCHTVPLRPPLTCTWAGSEEPRRSWGRQRRGPYAAEAAHLVAQPFVRPIPGASPSIFVSLGQMGKDRGGRKFFYVLFCFVLFMTERQRRGASDCSCRMNRTE